MRAISAVALWRTLVVLLVALAALAGLSWSRRDIDPSLTAQVRRGSLMAEITTTGTLRPAASLTYRSPVAGRELEIVELAPEGTRVEEGDLLVRLDATELERDAERLRQELRQLQMDLQVAHIERQEAEVAVRMVNEGDGALAVEEARSALELAEKKAQRLQQEYEQLQPLIGRGFITREEFARTASQLEEAEENLALVRKRTDIAVRLVHPRDRQRAALQLAQKNAQVEHLVGRVQQAELRLAQTQALIDACTIGAKRAGLVVYEQFLSASPRRKVRVGDRVTASQGLITIPEVDRMLLESTISEADVHRVKAGQRAVVRLEAFPDLRLAGSVTRVGTLASSSLDRPFEEKRFDLLIAIDTPSAELRPEMTARADITVDRRDGVLLVPVTAVFENRGTFLANVPTPAGVQSRRLKLGESNSDVVEVLEGLKENETVLLGNAPVREPAMATATTGRPDRDASKPY
jgi:multidrug resistance efflux pump